MKEIQTVVQKLSHEQESAAGGGDTIWRHRSGSTLVQVMACCLRHQAITCANVDLSSVKSSDNCRRAISQEIPQPSITQITLKFTYI